MGISFGYEVLQWVSNRINDDSNSVSEYYNLFWSFQFLASLINGVHIWYMHNILVLATVIPVTASFVYSPITVVWYMYNHTKGNVPFTKSHCCCLTYNKRKVPFTMSPCSCLTDYKPLRIIVNMFAVGNSFVFFVYMTYALPWIVLGFYLYPIKILVRISAIFTGAFCIIGISFVILKYLEECLRYLKQCICKNNKCCYRERCGYEPIEETDEIDETQSGESVCNCISAATKCVTGVLVLVCSGFIGYLLYHIIFVFTSDVEEALVEILHTLPLVVIPLTAYIIHKLMRLGNAETNADSQTGSTPEETKRDEHGAAEVHAELEAEAANGGGEGIEEARNNTE